VTTPDSDVSDIVAMAESMVLVPLTEAVPSILIGTVAFPADASN
jgi:hypothetical protein